MRKRFPNITCTAVLSALLCMSLAGCSDAARTGGSGVETSKNTPQEGSKVVTLTIGISEASHASVNEMIEGFKEQYAGQAEFDIQLYSMGESEARDKILTDVHSAPDVFVFPDDQLLSLAAGGVLDPVPDPGHVIDANTEGSVTAASIGENLYAYPLTADNGYFLYYNKRYFTEGDVRSLDRILEVAAENEKKFSMPISSGWYLYSFFGNTGMELGLNEDGVTNYCNWNSTEGRIKGVDVVNAMLDIARHPGFLNIGDTEFMENVRNGDVIAGVSGVWDAKDLQAIWGDYGAVKLPTYTCAGQQLQMASFVGYKMVGVNAYSEHLEWAHLLADWISNEQNQLLFFETREQGPSNINAAASEIVRQTPAILAVVQQSEYGSLQRVGNNFWEPCTVFGETIAAGNPSRTDPQKLVDTLVTGITASVIK